MKHINLILIIVGVVVILCVIVVGLALMIDWSMGRQLSRARKERKFLEKNTARATIRSLTGTVVGRKVVRGEYFVTIALGQRTELDFESEDGYWTLQPRKKVDVYVREHYDYSDTLIARVPLWIDLYD